MTTKEAKEILENVHEYICYFENGSTATLDGGFTVKELEAVITLMQLGEGIQR